MESWEGNRPEHEFDAVSRIEVELNDIEGPEVTAEDIKPIIAAIGEIQAMLPHLPPEEVRRTLNLEVADFSDLTLLSSIKEEQSPFCIKFWKRDSEKAVMEDVVATVQFSRPGDDEHALAFDITPSRIIRREIEFPIHKEVDAEDFEEQLRKNVAQVHDRQREAAELRAMTGGDVVSKKAAERILAAVQEYKDQLRQEREYLATLQAPEGDTRE